MELEATTLGLTPFTTAGLQGADVTACAADVQDGDSIDRVISQADARYPLDLVIANAGIASTDKSFTPKLVCHTQRVPLRKNCSAYDTMKLRNSMFPDTTRPSQANHIIDVNVKGVFNTVLPAMCVRKLKVFSRLWLDNTSHIMAGHV